MSVTESYNLVKKGVGIAHRTGRFTGDPEKCFIIISDVHFSTGFCQTLFYFFNGNQTEIELLAAAFNSSRNLLKFSSSKNKDYILRWFFYSLKKCVEGACCKHVDFIDDVNLVAAV